MYVLPCLQISKYYLVDVHRHLLMNFSNVFCGFQFQARVYYYYTSIGWHFLKCNFSPSIFTIENRIIWERIQHRSGSGMKKKNHYHHLNSILFIQHIWFEPFEVVGTSNYGILEQEKFHFSPESDSIKV